MKRGVIILTSEELKSALGTFQRDNYESQLFLKMSSAFDQNQAENKVEVSEEELEFLMDNIGAPTPEEPRPLKSLRVRLQQFLYKLRTE